MQYSFECALQNEHRYEEATAIRTSALITAGHVLHYTDMLCVGVCKDDNTAKSKMRETNALMSTINHLRFGYVSLLFIKG